MKGLVCRDQEMAAKLRLIEEVKFHPNPSGEICSVYRGCYLFFREEIIQPGYLISGRLDSDWLCFFRDKIIKGC